LSETPVAQLTGLGSDGGWLVFIYKHAEDDDKRTVRACIRQIACDAWLVPSVDRLTPAQAAFTLTVVRD
jgi:hypothetical protein